MTEDAVLLTGTHRQRIETVCHEHTKIRGWTLHAVSARSTHVHIAVTANAEPKKVRDQFKANATRVLRQEPDPIRNEQVWTRGGDIEFIYDEEALERVVQYIVEAQDRMDRGK